MAKKVPKWFDAYEWPWEYPDKILYKRKGFLVWANAIDSIYISMRRARIADMEDKCVTIQITEPDLYEIFNELFLFKCHPENYKVNDESS